MENGRRERGKEGDGWKEGGRKGMRNGRRNERKRVMTDEKEDEYKR